MQISKTRVLIITILFLLCTVFVYGFDRQSSTPLNKSLADFPGTIGQWQAIGSQSMQDNVEDLLSVDDYILRNYIGPRNSKINMYVSYFSYTDRSKGYHSPLNCMPGSGWNIAKTVPVALNLPESGQEVTVNKLVLQQGRSKQISLYWYQCRGRILHNEYMERIYRVIDSIFKNRTDGAFIRLIASGTEQTLQKDTALLKDFAEQLIPLLRDYLPE